MSCDEEDYGEREFDRAPLPRHHNEPSHRKRKKSGLTLGILAVTLVVCCGGGGAALYVFRAYANDGRDRVVSQVRLNWIGKALHEYHDKHGGFPTDSYSPDGKPLLSWRVHLLPYVESDKLYKRFKLDEPWDSPNNLKLLDEMPDVYTAPDRMSGRSNRTFFQGFSNPGTLFGPPLGVPPGWVDPRARAVNPVGVKIAAIMDGPANTIAVVEAGEPVEWTKPEDLDASPGQPFPAIGGVRPKAKRANVLFADGSVRELRKADFDGFWRPLTTINGGEVVNLEAIE